MSFYAKGQLPAYKVCGDVQKHCKTGVEEGMIGNDSVYKARVAVHRRHLVAELAKIQSYSTASQSDVDFVNSSVREAQNKFQIKCDQENALLRSRIFAIKSAADLAAEELFLQKFDSWKSRAAKKAYSQNVDESPWTPVPYTPKLRTRRNKRQYEGFNQTSLQCLSHDAREFYMSLIDTLEFPRESPKLESITPTLKTPSFYNVKKTRYPVKISGVRFPSVSRKSRVYYNDIDDLAEKQAATKYHHFDVCQEQIKKSNLYHSEYSLYKTYQVPPLEEFILHVEPGDYFKYNPGNYVYIQDPDDPDEVCIVTDPYKVRRLSLEYFTDTGYVFMRPAQIRRSGQYRFFSNMQVEILHYTLVSVPSEPTPFDKIIENIIDPATGESTSEQIDYINQNLNNQAQPVHWTEDIEEYDFDDDEIEEVWEEGLTLAEFIPGYQPKLPKLSNKVHITTLLDRLFFSVHDENRIIDLMDNCLYLNNLLHCFFRKDRQDFVNLCIYLLSDSNQALWETLPVFMFNLNNVKYVRRTNSKLLLELCQYNNIAHSPLDIVEEQMFSIISKFNKAADSITSLSEKVQNQIDPAVASVSNFKDIAIQKATDLSDELVQQSRNLISKVDEVLPSFSGPAEALSIVNTIKEKFKEHNIVLVAHILNMFKETDMVKWSLSFATITSMLGINKSLIDKFLSLSSSSEEQIGVGTTKLLSLASVFLGKYSPTRILSGGMDTFLLMRETKAILELQDLLKGIAVEWGIIESPEVKLAEEIKSIVAKLLARSIEYESIEQLTPNKFLESTLYKRFEAHYKELIDLETDFIRNKISLLDGTTVISEIKTLSHSYRKMSVRLLALRRGTTTRQEPVALCFVGAPGIGKSKFINELISQTPNHDSLLTRAYFDKQKIIDPLWSDMPVDEWQVWNENVSESMDFADGYCGQEIHATDDLFQAASDNDHQRYINFISSQKYLTNQAALESKGLPYTSKLFVGSCNAFPTTSKTIKSVKALQRRFIVVRVEKVLDIPDEHDSSFQHLGFYVYKNGVDYVASPKTGGTMMHGSRVAEFVIDELENRAKHYRSEINYVEEQAAMNTIPLDNDGLIEMLENAQPVIDLLQDGRQDVLNSPLAGLRFWHSGKFYSLKHMIEQFGPYWDDLDHIMMNYKMWAPHSTLIYNLLDNTYWCQYSQAGVRFLIFSAEDNTQISVYTAKQMNVFGGPSVLERVIPKKHVDERLAKYVYDPIYYTKEFATTTVDNIYKKALSLYPSFATVINMFKENAQKFWDWVKEPLSYVAQIVTYFISYLYPTSLISLVHYLTTNFKGTIIVSTLSVALVCIYYKLKTFSNSNELCIPCATTINKDLLSRFETLKQDYCLRVCKIGTLYSSHTKICDSVGISINMFLSHLCCAGKCKDQCSHSVDFDPRSISVIRQVFLTVYGKTPPKFDEYFNDVVDCSQEISCAKHQQYWRNTAFENSSLSLKKLPRPTYTMESSDNSLKFKKRTTYTMEDIQAITEISKELDLAEEEVQRDPGAYSIIPPIMKSVVTCSYKVNGVLMSLQGLGFKNYVITPAHFFIDNTIEYYFIRDGERVNLKYIHADRQADICLWKFSAGWMFTEAVLTHIPTLKNLIDYLPSAHAAMLLVKRDPQIHVLHAAATYFDTQRVIIKGQFVDYKSVVRIVGIRSTSPGTQAGDCGSPLIMIHPKCTQKLIGYHILGSNDCSYSACLYKERVDDLLKYDRDDVEPQMNTEFTPCLDIVDSKSKLVTVDIMNLQTGFSNNSTYESRGDVTYVGEYAFSAVAAKDSSLEKHRLYGNFPIKAEPAPLSNSEVEDASLLHPNHFETPDILQTQIDKYSSTFYDIPDIQRDLDDMTSQLTEHFIGVLKNEDLSVMTEEEVLSGILHSPTSNGLDLRTTAGEPFSRLGTSQGKKKNSFVSQRLDPATGKKISSFHDLPHAVYLKNVIDLKEELATKKVRTLSLWKNCLKDETRPLEKCRLGKTRLFTASPFDTTYLGRKYFGKFKEAWQAARTKLFHSVGINPVSEQWTELVHDLLSKGSDFNDADFSSYDGNLRADFMRAAGKVVIDTIYEISKTDRNVMTTLWEEYVETYHVSGRTIQLCIHGNPSGNPMTTVVNCIVNLMYHWWCYRKISRNESLSLFKDNIGFTCFGDDVVFCSNELVTDFTFNNVSKYMEALGQVYTTAQKDSSESCSRTLSDITFLKRKFIKDGPYYLAPIDTDSIEQQFNYTYIGLNDKDTIKTQVDEACLEAALHGPTYFREFRQILHRAIVNDVLLSHHMSVMTYSDSRSIVIKRITELASNDALRINMDTVVEQIYASGVSPRVLAPIEVSNMESHPEGFVEFSSLKKTISITSEFRIIRYDLDDKQCTRIQLKPRELVTPDCVYQIDYDSNYEPEYFVFDKSGIKREVDPDVQRDFFYHNKECGSYIKIYTPLDLIDVDLLMSRRFCCDSQCIELFGWDQPPCVVCDSECVCSCKKFKYDRLYQIMGMLSKDQVYSICSDSPHGERFNVRAAAECCMPFPLSDLSESAFPFTLKLILEKKGYDECVEQVGEEEARVDGENHPQHPSPNVPEVSDSPISVAVASAETTSATGTSETAIESAVVVPGTTSTRIVTEIMTPSGMKPVIHMSNHDTLSLPPQDFQVSGSPPDWSIVWNPVDVNTVTFSDKTFRIMQNFVNYTCLGLFKIVAKLPLFSSQRFWVAFDALYLGASQDSLGFEWNPSEESEIYVLTPWTDSRRSRTVSNVFPDHISIIPLTDLVFTEGLPAQLEFQVYFAPHQLTLYTPTTVSLDSYNITLGTVQTFVNSTFTFTPSSSSIIISVHDYTYAAAYDDSPFTCTMEGDDFGPVDVINSDGSTVTTAPFIFPGGSVTVNCSVLRTIRFSYINTSNFDVVEEQIGGYSYNQNFSQNKEDYGVIGDHTARLDSHWSWVASSPFASLTDAFTFAPFSALNTYGFSDLLRHLVFSKYPSLQFRCTSVPTANILFRLTQLPPGVTSLPLAQALQLPGWEFDPKEGDLKVQPYWNYRNAGAYTSSANVIIQVNVLGGTISTEPVFVTALFNPSSMDYHHLSGVATDYFDVVEEQGLSSTDPQIETDTMSKPVDNVVNAPVEAEKRWQYLTSFQVDPTIGLVQIPILPSTLGPFFWRHMRRYVLWRGVPIFKLMINNGFNTNANIHFVQSTKTTPDIVPSVDPRAYLDTVGYSVTGAPGDATIVHTKWLSEEQFLMTNSVVPTLGYLYIVIPQNSAVNQAEEYVPKLTTFTVYVDTSNIELRIPQDPANAVTYAEPPISSFTRTASRVIVPRVISPKSNDDELVRVTNGSGVSRMMRAGDVETPRQQLDAMSRVMNASYELRKANDARVRAVREAQTAAYGEAVAKGLIPPVVVKS